MKFLSFLALTLGLAWAASQASADRAATDPPLAPSPTVAVENAIAAMIDGDEKAFRRLVMIRSAEGYLEAYVRRLFAAARLHQALAEHGIKGVRVRTDAGTWDRNETLPACVPAPRYWEYLLQKAKTLKWDVKGDVARPLGAMSLTAGYESELSAEQSDHSWLVVLADPTSGHMSEPNERREAAESLGRSAGLFDAATRKVEAGELRSIRSVNDFLFPREKTVP